MDDTRARIISATYRAVRQYGLDGTRVQNISALAGLSPGALYRYFKGKGELLVTAFTELDRRAAAVFDALPFDRGTIRSDPMGAFRALWQPYFRFWTVHPDETVFYHRFRDSELFPAFNRQRDVSYFHTFVEEVDEFMDAYPSLRSINADLLWFHILNGTVMYAKYVVEGVLPNTEETEDSIFRLLSTGMSGYLLCPEADPA